jgi:glycosyltransferase involved in cell wall biosynthesis
MTRVLHVFGTMDIGGAETRTLELLRALGTQGIEFHFLTLSGRDGVLDDEIIELGGKIHPLPLNIRFPFAFLRLLRSVRPDVVDSHVATFSGVLLLGAWTARVQGRVAHFRSDGDGHEDTLRRRAQRALMTFLIRQFATDIVGVSPSALTFGYSPDWPSDPRARVIVNGVPAFLPDPNRHDLRRLMQVEDAVIVLHVGRPSTEKNRVHTVHVLRALRSRGIDAHPGLVGGNGPDSDLIWQTVSSLGLRAFVHDLGARRDATQLMSQADILLLTSVREGLPGVVLESLSTGTPVVATSLPPIIFIGSQLPGVRAVSLNSTVDEWADAALAAVPEGRNPAWRSELKGDFDRSIFSQSRSLASHMALYRPKVAK